VPSCEQISAFSLFYPLTMLSFFPASPAHHSVALNYSFYGTSDNALHEKDLK